MLISPMSAVPIPKPRAFAHAEKKPIPLPRKAQKNDAIETVQTTSSGTLQNTFGRRLRSTSKQISGEISGKVQETKKAMIETTRLSVRRITRRFSSSSASEQNEAAEEVVNNNEPVHFSASSDIFNTIRFQSPITTEPEPEETNNSPVYMNCNGNETDSDDSISLPPPSHPPPPLPDESMYDQPQASPRPTIAPRTKYEAIFPINTPLHASNVSENSESTLESKNCSRNTPVLTSNSSILEPKKNFLRNVPLPASNSFESSDSNSTKLEPKKSFSRKVPLPASNFSESSDSKSSILELKNNFTRNISLLTNNSSENNDLKSSTIESKIFPRNVPLPASNSSGSSSDSKTNTPEPKSNLERSGSWSFYDPVTLNEVTYANTESVGNLDLKTDNRSSSDSSVYSELNSCYENYILELHKRNNENGTSPGSARATKSTIIEFDPLFNQSNASSSTDMAMLEQLLDRDLYWNMPGVELNFDQWSISSEVEDEFLTPPTPPKRFDSLGDDQKSPPDEKSRTNWFTNERPVSVSETKKLGWRKQLNDVLRKVPESARNIRAGLHKEKHLDRPTLNSKMVGSHKGILFRISRKSVEDLFGEFLFRWCILGNGTLTFYSDNGCDNVKENYTLDSILSVQLMEKKLKFETEMHCFEVSVCGKFGRSAHTFGCSSLTDCRRWMQKIAEALTNRFPMNVVADYKKMGWAYLRENVTGVWAGAWVILSGRNLYYAKDDVAMCTIDLRKARCIQLQEPDPETPKTSDKGPNLLVDTQEGTLYFRMWTSRDTKFWCLTIQSEAFNNGRRLDEQQLTKSDVPVILEKCINFIYAHGSMSEGIYRRCGSTSKVAEILTQFNQNAWAVTLTLDNCSEHDVANVLKRFIRDLPEPLLSSESSKYLFQIANSFQSTNEKVALYKSILEQFPPVTYNTLRRLLGHLHFVQSQSSKNRMSADNLAAIWGPTLIHHESPNGEWSPIETNLVIQLISLYRQLFPISSDELNKERLMLQVLERCFRGATTGQGPAHVKASGDLRVWVHLHNRNGEAVNITIGPQKLAADICVELSSKMKAPACELQLEEMVLNDCLRRPIHYSEKVLDVILRWGYWDEADRKDNCLVLLEMSKYKPFDKSPEESAIWSEDFKFADNKTRAFKLFTFKFDQMKLCYFKDRTCNVKVQEWNIEDILWYFGHEQRHNPQTKWSLTFILRTQPPRRSRSIPYFGNTIGGNDLSVRENWVSAMIRAEHNMGLRPPIMSNVH